MWRVGRSIGRTIYNENSVLIGVMDSPELATQVVDAVNSAPDNAYIDRAALVAELRRQVAAGLPEDDNMPWRHVALNLATSLDGTDWLAPAPIGRT